MKKTAFLFGTIFALMAVLLGALGAHALKSVLTFEQLNSFQTGIRLQMYHAIVLLFLGLINHSFELKFQRASTWLFIIGTVLFSFSIYLLNLQELLGTSLKWLGPVTPVGGSLLIIGWGLLLVDAIRLFIKK